MQISVNTAAAAARWIVVAFVVTTALHFVLRPLAIATGLVDTPNARKKHTGDVPVIGGIAIYLGVFAAALIGPMFDHETTVALTMGGLMVLVGVIDDRFDLKPWVRLLAHLAAAAVLVLGTGYTVESFGAITGFFEVSLGALAAPFTVVACIALVNACNMLDGMDGLAGGTSLVAFAAFAVVGLSADVTGVGLLCCAMVGAISGFLLFNLPARFNRPMRTFMGDAGSTVLGFVLAAVALVLVQPSKARMLPAYVLWFVPIPIFELFSSTARRLMNGHSPLHADNGHFHHRLLEAGFPVRLVFVLYFLVSGTCAAVGVVAYHVNAPEWVLFFGFIALFAAWLAFIRNSSTIAAWLPPRLRRDLSKVGV
jgi:UDP-GlcNAc:undecaprenyl-phosphate GlcNAc-1-phosphate transferase